MSTATTAAPSHQEALDMCVAKMRSAGINEACITQFSLQHKLVATGETGTIPESTISPAKLEELIDYNALPEDKINPDYLKETVVLKLNGGLATTMGLSRAKSLLEVKDDVTFMDFICRQVLHIQEQYKQPLKFMLMNSFSTSKDTQDFLEQNYPTLAKDYAEEVEVLQNKVPKILQDSLKPASYEKDRECEWVPPGHGDFYAALLGTGKLDKLLKEGYKYMFVSNSDNLAATLDLKLLTEFADKNHDFMIEFAERTEIDMKGSHLAKYNSANDDKSGRWLVREMNQCVPGEENDFRDIKKHHYFNTNNMWINLVALKKAMTEQGGCLPLPVVRNKKTVCPTDGASSKVFQLETAIGTAITFFPRAAAVVIPRTRFAPVKTCNDLLAVRSDCYVVTEDHRLVLHPARNNQPPVISLDDRFYNFLDVWEHLTPFGVPSLLKCDRLVVRGPVQFEKETVLEGSVYVNTESQESSNLNGSGSSGAQHRTSRPSVGGVLSGDVRA